jgi:hypothetical protein
LILRKNGPFFGVLHMFVPSLSWQNDAFIYKWLKKTVFTHTRE